MTRNVKVPTEVLRREYVFDAGTPPISLTELAEKHGLARSGVADKATSTRPTWHEQREEFRRQIGEKAISNMADDWAIVHKDRFEKMVQAMVRTLEKYIERLDNGEIKPSTRDAVAAVAALRVLQADERAQLTDTPDLIDPQSVTVDPGRMVELVPLLKRMLSGEVIDGEFTESDPEPGHADGHAPTGTEGTG